MLFTFICSCSGTWVQMFFVVDIKIPVKDEIGFKLGSLYSNGTTQAVINVSEAIPVKNFTKDTYGRYHIKENLAKLWDRTLLHR